MTLALKMEFITSTLSDDPEFEFRERLFTPWMGPDALQAHVNHMVELGMLPLYSEFQPEFGFREIYWTPGIRTYFEARSARDDREFREIVDRNLREGNTIATLQISDDGLYTSTWLDSEGLALAEISLKSLGISRAEIRS